ncbi:MAG: glycoside hydrolase family 18 protein [Bacteroidales bacterium]|nr:glycoside hydrolase family 18 protein [Bacteroidales bacterium]
MKHLLPLLAVIPLLFSCRGKAPAPETRHGDPDEKILVAYVYHMRELPDAKYLTHINYAFGHVSETFDGVRVERPDDLRKLMGIREEWPHIKILLSIGGWGSGRFSEMADDDALRASFARDCARVVDEYGLDGIDIDWEYPGSDMAEISASPRDVANYNLLMRDIRAAIGPDKLLTQATASTAEYYDFKGLEPYIDWTNIMAYDLGWAPYHNAPLYPSELVDPESISVDECVRAHLAQGVPPEKLVLGMPFYGHGAEGFPRRVDLTQADKLEGYEYHWHEVSQVPYLTDARTGAFAFGYDNPESLRIKAEYAVAHGLRGAMYWEYSGDTPAGDLRRTVYQALNGLLP